MTNGVLLDFTNREYIHQGLDGSLPISGGGQYVGYADDIKGVGTAYPAIAASTETRPRWNENAWKYLNACRRGEALSVTFPDLGSDCSIISVTPAGVSIQLHQTISGEHTLPAHVLYFYCIIDRVLTDSEIAIIKSTYGNDYAVCYDQTIDQRTKSGTVYHTGDLGWTPNTDVGASGEMQDLIDILANGDEVVFDDMYDISGEYDISVLTNITFSVTTKQACGLNCLDGTQIIADANGLPVNYHPVFWVGDGFMVDGFYGTQAIIDPMDLEAGGGSKEAWFRATNLTSFYSANCKFDTMGWLVFYLTSSSNAIFARNHFDNDKTCIYLSESYDNLIVAHNYFTGGYTAPRIGGGTNIFFDGVKTIHNYSDTDPNKPNYVENLVEDIVRDAIDTTGGFQGAVVAANVFRGLGITTMDIKSIYNTNAAYESGPVKNSGIVFEYNLCEDIIGTGLVVTTLWTIENTPDPDYAVGPVMSYRNQYYEKSGAASTGAFMNKNSKGFLSIQDLFDADLNEILVEISAEDEGWTTPSLLTESTFDRCIEF